MKSLSNLLAEAGISWDDLRDKRAVSQSALDRSALLVQESLGKLCREDRSLHRFDTCPDHAILTFGEVLELTRMDLMNDDIGKILAFLNGVRLNIEYASRGFEEDPLALVRPIIFVRANPHASKSLFGLCHPLTVGVYHPTMRDPRCAGCFQNLRWQPRSELKVTSATVIKPDSVAALLLGESSEQFPEIDFAE